MDHVEKPAPVYTNYYRDMAEAIRALAPMLRFREARNELWLLANNYEWLADYLDTHPALSEAARVALDVEWQARRSNLRDSSGGHG
ncbi:MAG TPA: hypothetical protein VEY89_02820 [Candidatus Dormibacteraeota bacterium]|nr:hypothetical protein [Candidatus Dormibacteraeota bacterium]